MSNSKFFLPWLSIAALVIALYVITPAPVILNKYQVAQHSTILIESGHGYGSGFVVQRGERLFVWTAAHVVARDNVVKVRQVIRFENHKVGETVFKARVIARDTTADLALLWLDAPPSYFSPVRFHKQNDNLPVGSHVFHVGNFYGPPFDGSVSTGVISQIGVLPSEILDWPWPVVDQTTMTVIPGSSGGPVFDDSGKIIGVVVGHVSPGVEFFVPLREMVVFVHRQRADFALNFGDAPRDAVLIRMAGKSEWKPEVVSLTPTPEGSTISGR
jgi:S1-C subfamily serine protease